MQNSVRTPGKLKGSRWQPGLPPEGSAGIYALGKNGTGPAKGCNLEWVYYPKPWFFLYIWGSGKLVSWYCCRLVPGEWSHLKNCLYWRLWWSRSTIKMVLESDAKYSIERFNSSKYFITQTLKLYSGSCTRMRIFGFIVIIGYIRIMFFFIGQTTHIPSLSGISANGFWVIFNDKMNR